MIALRHSPAFALALFCIGVCGEKPDHPNESHNPVAHALRLSQARRAIEFHEKTEAVRAHDRRLSSSAECESCHKDVYRNWMGSRHRVAFTNPIYKESHERENSVWCLNCHAPLMRPGGDPASPADRLQTADGISCIVCHVRDGQMITAKQPIVKQPVAQQPAAQQKTAKQNAAERTSPSSVELAHDYKVLPEFGTEQLCADCHQFNFLTRATSNVNRSEGFTYSDLVMQNTVGEWRQSSFAGKTGCGGCHLFPGTKASHSFPGGHSLEGLGRALKIEARYVSGRELRVSVYSLGIGHRFPTGDLFRTLRVRLLTDQGRPLTELVLRRSWALPEDSARENPNAPARRLESDTTIPPPAPGEHAARRDFYVTMPRKLITIRYEMYMDYLEEESHLLTRLPLSITRPLIKKGRVTPKQARANEPVG